MSDKHAIFQGLGVSLLLVMGSAAAQQARIDQGGGNRVHAQAGDGASVQIQGKVISAASGPGAVAVTRMGSRSLSAHSQAGETASVVIEGHGPDADIVVESGLSEAGQAEATAWTQQDFVNVDLSGRDFAGADLSNRVFINVDLSGASLRGADLRDTRWVNVDLNGADLRDANLAGAQLVNTDLDQAITTGLRR